MEEQDVAAAEVVGMDDEKQLRERLRKIEALFAGAGTNGERLAAGAAMERIRERLQQAGSAERSLEIKFTFPDSWSRQLFLALCRRYALRPYRYKGQRRTTVMVRAPDSFVQAILWPEFRELDEALRAYLASATERIIRDEVHRDTREAPEEERATRLE
jgi:hypothetical protein